MSENDAATGNIWVADHDGVYVIKMEGDVRLTLCLSFDEFIDSMFAADDFQSIIFDLSEAQAVDSTTLGLMAKISILAEQRKGLRPVVIANSAGIMRLLQTMGFDEIFDIIEEPVSSQNVGERLQEQTSDEDATREKVLESHRVLMELNEGNRDLFKDLVAALERL